jgi:hypothetical protein
MAKPIILATEGAYSDYRVLAIMQWLADDVTPQQAHAEYLASLDGARMRDWEFLAWLVRRGYAEDAEALEMWLGYSDPQLLEINPVKRL